MGSLFSHVLVPVDFSAHSERAALRGAILAQQMQAQLTLVHVFSPEFIHPYPEMVGEMMPPVMVDLGDQLRASAERGIQALADRLRQRHPDLRAEIIESTDRTGSAIVDFAGRIQADLIVIGSHGHSGLGRLLLGSTTDRVVHEAPCAVLVVK
ncbi:universal stress protein [Thermithiobacillus plumbiphilus]|uniref:Universal stress protein n=1 Tax=Thermithiobacillus plumbiphilus TaxID=1729899 RepID=A0ABU9D3Y8_9PROT